MASGKSIIKPNTRSSAKPILNKKSKTNSRPRLEPQARTKAPLTPAEDAPYDVFRVVQSNQSRKRKRGVAQPGSATTQHRISGLDNRTQLSYTVNPRRDGPIKARPWSELQSQQSFRRDSDTFRIGDVVLVQSDATAARAPSMNKIEYNDYYHKFWVAEILEIRYLDPLHVYLGVFWLYRPEEISGGRQSYHAEGEVLSSNHMDIISAFAVESASEVHAIDDQSTGADGPASGYNELVRRFRFDAYKRSVLDPPISICTCQQPANPDYPPLLCNDAANGCGRWMHEDCVEDHIAQAIY